MALVALVVVIYGAVVTAYATSGGDPSTTDTRQPSANGVLVYLDLDGLDGDTYSLDTRVSVYPGKDHLDSDGRLDRAMTVSVTPAASTDTMTFPAGTRAGSRPLTLYIDGDIHRWPFDTYNATGLQVRVTSDGSVVPAEVVVTNLMTSWAVHQHDVDSSATGNAITISAARTPAVIGFALALCVVLLVLPTLTLFVAISTLRRRKQFLPPIVTWFAVMLFAVIPLRNLFPGNPPIGSWVDYTVVLWVVVGLTVALTLYITAWWKHGQ
ncbi:hypothetical protein GCM10009722_00450 [Williamsia deligens]|nr:protein of unknown function (DUF4436) [Williamsia deligens]